MKSEIVTQKEQMDFFLLGMSPIERKIINEVLQTELSKSSKKDIAQFGVLQQLTIAIQYIFLYNILHSKRFPDTVSAFEYLVDACSPAFLFFITELDLGASLGFSPLPHKWERLPNNIGKLKNLRRLFLNHQPITNLEPLSNNELSFICLEGCLITDLSPLNFNRLYWCNIRHTRVKDVAPIINRGKKISMIPMEQTLIEDPAQIFLLTKLEMATHIYLSGTPVVKLLPEKINDWEKTKNDEYHCLSKKINPKKGWGRLSYLNYLETH